MLEDNDIETYVPMHDITKLINGKRRTFHEPLLPDIVFARLSRTMAEQFVKDPAPSSTWLKSDSFSKSIIGNDNTSVGALI